MYVETAILDTHTISNTSDQVSPDTNRTNTITLVTDELSRILDQYETTLADTIHNEVNYRPAAQ